MKIRNSVSREIIALIVAVLVAMFLAGFVMIKLMEASYKNYVYDSKTDTLNGSIRSVESELEKIENTTYQMVTNSDIQKNISQWLDAEKTLKKLENMGSETASRERLEKQKQKIDSMREIIQHLDPVITADRSIVTGFFISPDGYRNNGYGGSGLSIEQSLQEAVIQQAREHAGDPVYLVCNQVGTTLKSVQKGEGAAETRLLLARTVRERKGLSMEHGGTLVFMVDPKLLTDSYTSFNHKLLIQDPSYGIIFSNLSAGEEREFLKGQARDEKNDRYQIMSLGDRDYFVTEIISGKQGWRYYSISSYDELFGLLDKADMVYLLIFAFLTILICAAAVRFSMNLVRPIAALSGTIRSIRESNKIADNLRSALPGLKESKPRQDEVGELQGQFYEMALELDKLIRENYQQRIYLQQAQLSALRTQLNPHFLYNTLDLIRWLSVSQRSSQIPAVVKALGDILRAAINNRKNRVTIGEEVDYVRGYLSIQKIRFGERLKMCLEIPEEWMDFLIPVFSIQPLVENAVNYALEQMDEPCSITVTVEEVGEQLRCTVTDNGPGMDEDLLKKCKEGARNRGNGIGLINLDKRLKNLYGPEYGVQIHHLDGKGASVSFCVRKERSVECHEELKSNHCR